MYTSRSEIKQDLNYTFLVFFMIYLRFYHSHCCDYVFDFTSTHSLSLSLS